MKIIPLKIKLLSPLFNYAQITNGGALTSSFIGDIALTYALNRSLKIQPFYQEMRFAPNYQEIKALDFLFTVAKPLTSKRTGVYIRNTLFNWDGGPDMDVIGKEGTARKTTFKNYFKVQGIQIGAEFSTYLICKNDFTLNFPVVVRLGTGRECLATLEKRAIGKNDDKEIWLNAYVLKEVFGEEVFRRFVAMNHYYIDYQLENYILLKKLNEEQVAKIFEGQF